jgi:polysaccharide deacetylase family protein (PEP-CTERM system associated)
MNDIEVPSGAPENGRRRFAMSVDVEDYFQVWAFSQTIDPGDWDRYELRVDAACRRVLDLLDRNAAKGTFFILGWVAERAPSLIREIAARGHEIASHGYAHVKAFEQTADEFRRDVAKAKRIIEDVSGRRVIGYRAAGFSLDHRTPWAHQILAETGHLYSSSSHPVPHDHYGNPSGPRTPHQIDGVIEAPILTGEFLGRRIPCAGGGWFRATPYAVSRMLIARAAQTAGGPAIFYFHPWEIDAGQPRITDAPLHAQIRHYFNLGRMEYKLERLLRDFAWMRIDEALEVRAAKAEAA